MIRAPSLGVWITEVWPIATLPTLLPRRLRAEADINLPTVPAETVENDQNVWTGCISQERLCVDSEVADMYPACLIGSRAVALMGIRSHLWSH